MDIRNYIRYLPETGELIWIKKPNSSIVLYTLAGWLDENNYRKIIFNNKWYSGHRLAWYLHYGVWPKGHLDHINGDASDNRIENLREVTHKENMRNTVGYREKLFKYRYFNKQSKKWKVESTIDGKKRYHGLFDTEKEAIDFIVFNIELFPGFKI